MPKKVIVIGTGPGGLTSAMLLAHHGYQVEVFEKQPYIGGRNGSLTFDGFTFDIGPTFLMMKYILDEMFELSGRRTEQYLTIKEIEPLYRLVFSGNRVFMPSARDREGTLAQMEELFPGSTAGYWKFMTHEKKKFDRLVPCLQVPYTKWSDYLKPRMLRALPYLDAHRSVFGHLGRFFAYNDLKTAFTFQAKYLGMSPWECPATFSMLSYIEHGLGIWHPIGGLNQITKAMAKVVEEDGGKIHLGVGVAEVVVNDGKATGVKLDNGETVHGDYVLLNADFAHAMHNLIPRQHLKKWTPETLAQKRYSCSTFMLYLGLDNQYDIPHHNIIFTKDYEQNVRDIAETKRLSKEFSIYIQNTWRTDPTLAPPGQSAVYILVPAPNTTGPMDWDKEAAAFRDRTIEIAETDGGMTGLRQHIIAERVITPFDWQRSYFVHNGATFNLAHNVRQMLIWRPHNASEDIGNMYLVGGGTHPGSGLPTIFESGRISSALIMARDGKKLE